MCYILSNRQSRHGRETRVKPWFDWATSFILESLEGYFSCVLLNPFILFVMFPFWGARFSFRKLLDFGVFGCFLHARGVEPCGSPERCQNTSNGRSCAMPVEACRKPMSIDIALWGSPILEYMKSIFIGLLDLCSMKIWISTSGTEMPPHRSSPRLYWKSCRVLDMEVCPRFGAKVWSLQKLSGYAKLMVLLLWLYFKTTSRSKMMPADLQSKGRKATAADLQLTC